MTKLINHIGFIVRDNIPISIPYWKTLEAQDDEDAEGQEEPAVRENVVPDTEKAMLWKQITDHFTFPEGTKLEDVRTWAMQKCAVAFQTFKKRLNKDFIKKGLTPDFTKKGYSKLENHWDAFVQYKQSNKASKKVATNNVNARKKTVLSSWAGRL